jgi:hypothetical protein
MLQAAVPAAEPTTAAPLAAGAPPAAGAGLPAALAIACQVSAHLQWSGMAWHGRPGRTKLQPASHPLFGISAYRAPACVPARLLAGLQLAAAATGRRNTQRLPRNGRHLFLQLEGGAGNVCGLRGWLQGGWVGGWVGGMSAGWNLGAAACPVSTYSAHHDCSPCLPVNLPSPCRVSSNASLAALQHTPHAPATCFTTLPGTATGIITWSVRCRQLPRLRRRRARRHRNLLWSRRHPRRRHHPGAPPHRFAAARPRH